MRAASMLVWIGLGSILGACTNDVETGRASYAELCAGCHGADGRGDGPNALSLALHPSDLTGIASRNSGIFPHERVMAKIDGYATGRAHDGAMPAFWPLLDGRTVLVKTGEGILTPTPEPLVALTAYIESIQE